MPSHDTRWTIGSMMVLVAILCWCIHTGFTDLIDAIDRAADVSPGADLVQREKLAVLCYDANGNDAIAKEIKAAMKDWTLAKSTHRGNCIAYKASTPNDVVSINRSLARIAARIAEDHSGQLDYVVLGHNLDDHIMRPYPRPW